MQIDIRKSIQANFQGATTDEIRQAIQASIETREELALPGLGVFFEILWNRSKEEEKKEILGVIQNGL